MKELTVYTRIGNNGQEITHFTLPYTADTLPQQVAIDNNHLDTTIDCFLAMQTGRKANGITNISVKDGLLRIDCAPFSYLSKYRLTVDGRCYDAQQEAAVVTEWADSFVPLENGELLYRLYKPETRGARPLILFLHGGGETGTDNWSQLSACFGPVYLAETYPDCYVMAPQAKGIPPTPEQVAAFKQLTFAQSDHRTDAGWNRRYLGLVCDEIRNMIRDGLVDENRVYVTGLSMGGAGTIRALSVGAGLFAAAMPVCPSMTPETYAILCGLRHTKLWIAASYIDHTLYRHKYLVDGIFALRDAGNQDARLTLYSPEDLAKYGIGVIDNMPLESLFGWNHMCWVPAYRNEQGIMGWMMSQTKS